MKPDCFLLLIAVMGTLGLQGQSSKPLEAVYPAEQPAAGIQPRRPANYKSYKYPLNSRELLTKYGPGMEKMDRAAWADIEKVNNAGPYKNTYASLASHHCPEWFKDAKIGMFIDWGPWSIGGHSIPEKGASYPDWYEMNILRMPEMEKYHRDAWGADVAEDDLVNLLSGTHFNPDSLTRLARDNGFRYVVPFLKHHGGYCLWQSSYTRRNSMDWGPHRDFAMEFSQACKREGLKFGAYVSDGEWGYPAILPGGKTGAFTLNGKLTNDTSSKVYSFLPGKIPVKDYARDYLIPSLKELFDRTRPDLIWYDGGWENTSDVWRTRDIDAYYYNMALRNEQEVCINDRAGSDYREKKVPQAKTDYSTVEFDNSNSPSIMGVDDAWEICRSFSHNFGYNWTEESDSGAILSDKACIDLVVDIIGRGGNLLLIVSPTGRGEIPPRQLHAIRNMGDWLKKYGEAIYDTRSFQLREQPVWGRITHSKDASKVYLLITKWPADGRLQVPSLPIGGITNASVMNGGGTPGFTQPNTQGFIVDLSACMPGDTRAAVVVINTKTSK